MLIEIHCPCGQRLPLLPEKVQATSRCSDCKKALHFAPPGRAKDQILWLAVGGQTGAPRLAIPMPVGVALTLGRSPKCWISTPGDEIEDIQAEIQLGDGGRVEVKHVAGDSGTWINRARIASGVLSEKDRLRIGPYVMKLMTHSAVLASMQSVFEPEVEVEVDESSASKSGIRHSRRARIDADDEDSESRDEESSEFGESEDHVDYRDGWSGGQKARLLVCVILILGAGSYLARVFLFPPLSEEMPSQTVFYCPADGTAVHAEWTAASGAPICPNCGQRCLGEQKYKAEVIALPSKPAPAADKPIPSQPAEETDEEKAATANNDKSKDESPPKKKKSNSRKGASKGGSK